MCWRHMLVIMTFELRVTIILYPEWHCKHNEHLLIVHRVGNDSLHFHCAGFIQRHVRS